MIDEREPAALEELLDDGDDEDEQAEQRRDDVGGQVARPGRIVLRGAAPRTRVIAMFESENVTNTLIEYMTTSFETCAAACRAARPAPRRP